MSAAGARRPQPGTPAGNARRPQPGTPAGNAVEADAVSKFYGDAVALSDVTFSLPPGVTGLLGHNGSGKTTTLALLAGWSAPSDGTVRVLGRDPRTDVDVHRGLGVVPDGDRLWSFLTARQTVTTLVAQRGVAEPGAAADRALHRVGLTDAADRKVSDFSKGMRQRVRLAQALAHDPEVLLLDEPLNGLDPAQRRADVDLVRALGAEGRTVLVSSHVLAEVERMADRLLVLVDGRLLAEGPPEAIRAAMVDRPRQVRLVADRPRVLAAALLADGTADAASLDGDVLVVTTSRADTLARALAPTARAHDVVLRRVEPVGEDLESVFTALTRAVRGVGR